MTIVIGIQQQNDRNGQISASSKMSSGQILSAGPFASRAQAQAWQEYVHRRCRDGRVLACADNESTAAPWYGYIIEQ